MPEPLLKAMFEAGELVAVCPEVLGGLDTPRDPAEIVSEDPVELFTNQGIDVTTAYRSGADQAVAVAKAIDANLAILKSKSPSCGSKQIYDGSFQGQVISGAGVTARAMRAAGIEVVNEEEASQRFKENSTRILVLRHAESVFSSDERGRGLSESGEQAAQELVESFKDIFRPERIYSSPYVRAMDTVKPLAKVWDRKIELDERLQERKSTEMSVEDFAAFAKKQWLDHHFALLGCESLNDVANRGKEMMMEVETENRGKTILLSTHGTWMGAVMHDFDPSFDHRAWKNLKMPDLWEIIFYRGVWVETKRVVEER
jgi:2,3-bisphosphoglycerate-dependent phosphoglycerate mutase